MGLLQRVSPAFVCVAIALESLTLSPFGALIWLGCWSSSLKWTKDIVFWATSLLVTVTQRRRSSRPDKPVPVLLLTSGSGEGYGLADSPFSVVYLFFHCLGVGQAFSFV